MRSRIFTAPNGVKKELWFRDGTNDESTIIACFEEDHYGIMKENLKAGDVVIDLGAHIGGVTCLLATIPGIKIIAVEALPENCEILKKNLEQGGANGTEVVVHEKAIWSKSNQEVKICYGDDSESGKVHKYVGTIGVPGKRESYTAETISLLSIFRQEKIKTCKLLKTDIEGAETEAIGKAPKHVLKRIKKIKGEYHSGDYKQLLKDVGSIFKDYSDKSTHDFEFRRKNARQ